MQVLETCILLFIFIGFLSTSLVIWCDTNLINTAVDIFFYFCSDMTRSLSYQIQVFLRNKISIIFHGHRLVQEINTGREVDNNYDQLIQTLKLKFLISLFISQIYNICTWIFSIVTIKFRYMHSQKMESNKREYFVVVLDSHNEKWKNNKKNSNCPRSRFKI